MILHIISASPFSSDALQRCLTVATDQDAILLTEDATLALSNVSGFLAAPPTSQLFVLEPDRQARGVMLPAAPAITGVDFDGFVALTAHYAKSVSWF